MLELFGQANSNLNVCYHTQLRTGNVRLEASEHKYQCLLRDSDGLCDDVAKVLESVASRIRDTQTRHQRTIALNHDLQQRVTHISQELVAKNARVQFLEARLRSAGIAIDSAR